MKSHAISPILTRRISLGISAIKNHGRKNNEQGSTFADSAISATTAIRPLPGPAHRSSPPTVPGCWKEFLDQPSALLLRLAAATREAAGPDHANLWALYPVLWSGCSSPPPWASSEVYFQPRQSEPGSGETLLSRTLGPACSPRISRCRCVQCAVASQAVGLTKFATTALQRVRRSSDVSLSLHSVEWWPWWGPCGSG